MARPRDDKDYNDGWTAAFNRQQAEIERLRALLAEVREISTKWGNSIPWSEGERLAKITAEFNNQQTQREK